MAYESSSVSDAVKKHRIPCPECKEPHGMVKCECGIHRLCIYCEHHTFEMTCLCMQDIPLVGVADA